MGWESDEPLTPPPPPATALSLLLHQNLLCSFIRIFSHCSFIRIFSHCSFIRILFLCSFIRIFFLCSFIRIFFLCSFIRNFFRRKARSQTFFFFFFFFFFFGGGGGVKLVKFGTFYDYLVIELDLAFFFGGGGGGPPLTPFSAPSSESSFSAPSSESSLLLHQNLLSPSSFIRIFFLCAFIRILSWGGGDSFIRIFFRRQTRSQTFVCVCVGGGGGVKLVKFWDLLMITHGLSCDYIGFVFVDCGHLTPFGGGVK